MEPGEILATGKLRHQNRGSEDCGEEPALQQPEGISLSLLSGNDIGCRTRLLTEN